MIFIFNLSLATTLSIMGAWYMVFICVFRTYYI